MSKQVIFRDRQETNGTDLSNIGGFAQAAIDTVVADAITSARRFVGFTVTQETATSVRASVGRLLQEGLVYLAESEAVLNLANYLPLANKRLVAICAGGQPIETDVQPRDFVIDLTTGETEPQAVAMLAVRQAQLAVIGGVESVDPQLPALADNLCLVAVVTMGTAGILSIEAYEANRLVSVEKNSQDIVAIKIWQALTGPKVDALTSQMAALDEETDGKADLDMVFDLQADVARLKAEANLPDGYSSYATDTFADDTKVDTALTGDGARISDGLLFPDEAVATRSLALFNPIEPAVTRSAADLVLPKYTSVPVLQANGYAGDLSISQYQVQSHEMKEKTAYEYVTKYGWVTSRRPSRRIFGAKSRQVRYETVKEQFSYQQLVPTTAYEETDATIAYNGALVAQTFINPRAGWLTQLDLFFTQIGPDGDVTVAICEVDEGGKPKLDAVLTRVTVAQAALKKYPAATPFVLSPVFVEAGKRYAHVIITQGDHYIARVAADGFTQGTLFYGTDGEYVQGDLTKDAMFRLYMASFAATRTEVMLGEASLAGGITDLEITAPQVVPDGTALLYEIQVAGKWTPLTELGKLATAPGLLPLRVVLLGTTDLAPALQLADNAIRVSRPALAVSAVSTLRSLPAAEENIRVDLVTTNYDAAKNTIAAKLVDEAGANPVTVSSVESAVDDPSGLTIRHRFTFNLGAARDTYKIDIEGTRTADGPPFAVIERTDIAY